MRKLLVPLFLASLTTAAMADTTLTLGTPAPALKVSAWVKGGPVTLGKGKVNVVEFWATWCGPCKTSIPHLTELAKKYSGKVDFTGVSISERTPKDQTLGNVKKFVADMGAKMDYHVALDTDAKDMANGWMTASGQQGIPTAFVVDQKGTVIWIGHPMDGLDEVLGQIIAGKYDMKKEAARMAEEQKKQAAYSAVMRDVNKAYAAKDYPAAVKALDAGMALAPDMKVQFQGIKVQIMIKYDESGAQALMKSLAGSDFKNDAMQLNAFSWIIVDDASKLKSPDYALAVSMAARATELTKEKDAFILDTYATALFKSGDKAAAIDAQKKAVALLETRRDIPEATKKEIRDRLATFMKG